MTVLFKTAYVPYVAVATTAKNQGINNSGIWGYNGYMDMIIFCAIPYILAICLAFYIWHRG